MPSVSPFRLHFMFIVCLTFYAGNGQAEIFKWTDENGQTHFGDRPPENKKAMEISSQLENINISRDLSSPEMMLKHEKMKAQEKQRQASEQHDHEKRQRTLSNECQKAQKSLWKLKGRVVFRDELGNEIKVSETERKRRALEMENMVRKHCL